MPYSPMMAWFLIHNGLPCGSTMVGWFTTKPNHGMGEPEGMATQIGIQTLWSGSQENMKFKSS